MAGATRAWAGLNLVLAGVLLGLCYLRTRSLALPMGLHLGWNWTQGSLLGFGVSGLPSGGWWTPVYHGRPLWLTGGRSGWRRACPAPWWRGGLPGAGAGRHAPLMLNMSKVFSISEKFLTIEKNS